MDATWTQRVLQIAAFYVGYLGRVPDAQGLDAFLRSGDSVETIRRRIGSSDERQAIEAARASVLALLEPYVHKRKLLLFGAFGNGNLGDREMARIVAERLEHEGAGAVVCFAFSELTFADYDFPAGRKLDRALLPLLAPVLALFDGLVIGGGGLLYYTHEPIWDPDWGRLIPIPYALFACGVGSPLDIRLHDLVRGATVASSRDLLGLASLAAVNPGAQLCPDPILSSLPVRPPKAPPAEPGAARRLFVLRAPLRDWHADIECMMRAGDAVAIFEAHVDHPIAYRFGQVSVVSTTDEFAALVGDFDLVVTDRYHAAILSLLNGCPVIGLCKEEHTSKQAEFFRELDLAPHCHDVTRLPADFLPYDMARTTARLRVIQEEAEISYRAACATLFAAINGRRATSDSLDAADATIDRVLALAGPAPEPRAPRGAEHDAEEDRDRRMQAELDATVGRLVASDAALGLAASRGARLAAQLEAAQARTSELTLLLAEERAAGTLARTQAAHGQGRIALPSPVRLITAPGDPAAG